VATGVTTVTVLVGVGSGVVLVPTAVLVMLPAAGGHRGVEHQGQCRRPLARLATVAVAPAAWPLGEAAARDRWGRWR
jgi:hypothetical protein